MSMIFKPRRGKKSTMTTKNTVLAAGELFVEVPDGGVGTGKVKMKMGDGSTAYSSLPYAVEDIVVQNQTVAFSESSSTENIILLSEITSGATMATLFGSIKKMCSNLNTQISALVSKNSTLNTNMSNVETKITTARTTVSNIESLIAEIEG